MDDETVYRDFIRWLNQAWFTLPETEELLPLIRARYTPDEAALLTGVPFSTKGLDELAAIKESDPVVLGGQLDALANKGLVYRTVKDDHVRYRLNDAPFVFLRSTFWPGRSDTVSKATAPLVNRYYYGGFFDQYEHVHHKGLRSVPIEGTIEDTRRVIPYEDVLAIVNEQDYWSVSHCPCRHRKNIDPDSPDLAIRRRYAFISGVWAGTSLRTGWAGKSPATTHSIFCVIARRSGWFTAFPTGESMLTRSATAANAAACGWKRTTG